MAYVNQKAYERGAEVVAAAMRERGETVPDSTPVVIDNDTGAVQKEQKKPLVSEHVRRSKGGRPKGSINMRSQGLLAQLRRKFPGFDPIMEMAKIAIDQQHTPELRLQASKEIAKYVYPTLRAVEHSGGTDDAMEITVRIVPHGGD